MCVILPITVNTLFRFTHRKTFTHAPKKILQSVRKMSFIS